MRGDLQKIDSVNKHEVKPYHMILLRLIKAKYILFKKNFIHNFWRVNNNIISYFLQLEDKFQKTDFVNRYRSFSVFVEDNWLFFKNQSLWTYVQHLFVTMISNFQIFTYTFAYNKFFHFSSNIYLFFLVNLW